MSYSSKRNLESLIRQVHDKATPVMSQLCQESPEALFALTELWRLWADPNASVPAFEACFGTLIDNDWMDRLEILETAVELQRPNALRALRDYVDFSSFGANGFHLHDDQDVREIRAFPNDRGWVARTVWDQDYDWLNLPVLAEISGEPTVWCESLPMVGTRVSWLELALGARQWKNAEVLWKLECDKGPLENQAYARLALAFLSGVVERGGTPQSPEQEQVFLKWWDRLLPTTFLMTEEVPVEAKIAKELLWVEGRDNSDPKYVKAVLRPIDLIPFVAAQLSIQDGLANPIRQRLKAVDWSTVGPDGSGRLPAHAALDRLRAHRPALYDHLWVNLLEGMSHEQKDLWWKNAFSKVLSDPAPLAATSALFKGQYGLEDTHDLFRAIVEQADEQKRYHSSRVQSSQARLAQVLVNEVLPPVIACSTPEAKKAWKGYRDGLVTALKDTNPSLDANDERWRALDMAFRLPLPEAPRPKMRF